ncbi:MAG: HAMP domain-containing histidine kinase [Myxococcales bacterium]|nr:HAMP domain-containing histidine kinase [Myxococcales bacterium]
MLHAATRKLAHDLSNALVAAVTRTEMLGGTAAEGVPADDLAHLRAALARPGDVLRGALLSVRARSAQRPRSLAAVEARLQAAVGARAGTLAFWIAGDALHGPDEELWAEVIDIITQNSLDAFAVDALEPEPDTPAPHLRVHLEIGNGRQVLCVTDNGPGCPAWPRVAAGPTARAGHGHLGLGLGLAAARLAECEGTLDVGPAQPRGAVASAQVPGAGRAPEPVDRARA